MLSATSFEGWCGTSRSESTPSVASAIPVGNAEDDPDDSFNEATLIGVGDSILDSIEVGDDVDIFQFTVLADQVVSFDIDIPSEDLDSYIKVFDGDGFELAANNDAPGPDDEYSNKESFVTVTFTSAGTYYVGVSAPPNVSYDPFTGEDFSVGTTTGGYQLTLISGSGGGGDDDPDDQISQAQPMAIGGTTTGHINVGTDVDMYVFTVSNTQTISIDVDASALNSYLRLFDSSGGEIAANDDDIGPPLELSGGESFLQILLTPGVYYVGVSSSGNAGYDPIDGGGDSGGNSTGSYDLTITAEETSVEDDDDQMSEAFPIDFQSVVGNSIASSDDVDMFVITVPGPMRVGFDLDIQDDPTLDTFIRLFDDSGNELGANNDAYGLSNELAANESYFEFTFTSAGTFYVGVSSNANNAYDPFTGDGDQDGLTSGQYTLTLYSMELDFDDQLIEALPLNIGVPVSDALSTSSDVDMYIVSANPGETLVFDIDRPIGSLNSYLRLFDSFGVEVAASNDGAGPDPEYAADESLLSFTSPSGGVYYLGVSSLNNTEYDAQSGTDDNNGLSLGNYELTLTIGVLPNGDLDDQISEAVPVAAGVPVSRVISVDSDVDMYSFNVTAGETLTFDIDTSDGALNSYIRLFRDDGVELSSNDDDPSLFIEDSYLQYTFPTSGTYYLGVSASLNSQYDPSTGEGDFDGTSAGAYTLTISSDVSPPDGDPDDTIGEATPISVGVVTPGVIDAFSDVDMFQFTVAAGDRLSFDVDVTGGDLDPFMYLFDDTGFPLDSNDNSLDGPPPNFSILEPFLSYTFPVAGTYYIGISAYNNTGYHPGTGAGDANGGSTGSYDLTITVDGGSGFDDVDDEIREAFPAPVGSAVFGALESPTDVDMYEVIVGENEALSFDIDVPSEDLNSYLRLFNEAGEELAVNDDGIGDAPEYTLQESLLVYAFLTPGKYYIGVSAKGNDFYDPLTGEGDGTGATTFGNYILTINLSDADDQISEAQPIAPGDAVGGNISSETDVDMYAVTVTAGQTLRFDIDLPGSGLNSYIQLFNLQGDLLAENDDAVGPGEEFSIQESYVLYTFPTAGTYYLGVSAFNNIFYGPLDGENDFNGQSSGSYILSITSNTQISTPLIIDNSDPGFTVQGEWPSGNGTGVGRNDNIRLAFGESFLPTDIATWTFNLPGGSGRYRVSATWFTNTGFPGLFTNAARYEVSDPGVGAIRGTSVMNQKQFPNDFVSNGSAWEDLGTFDIMGSTLVVKLYSTTDNATYVVADAIRIERVGSLSLFEEINVIANGQTGINVLDGASNVDLGATDFTKPVTQTFTITNSGSDQLSLDSPVSVTGTVFSVIAQPGLTLLNPGQSTTFTIRMDANSPGEHSAFVSFANSDGNENPFNFTISGTVRTTVIIDDGDLGFVSSPAPGQLGGWGQIGGPGRGFDYQYSRDNPGVGPEFTTWTFNVTPGQYRVSTTWAFFNPGFDDTAPFTIFDGTVAGGKVVGGRYIDQQHSAPSGGDYPTGFEFPLGTSGSQNWERVDIVNVTGTTLTVQLLALDPQVFVVADSILIDRLGDIPVGPELVVTESNRNVNGATLEYGLVQLNQFVDKTFTIRNTGTSLLNITTPVTISGTNNNAFTVVQQPTLTAIPAGGISTFVVRMTASHQGFKDATIEFGTDDADEGLISLPISGQIEQFFTSDDGVGEHGYTQVGMTYNPNIGIAYRNDFSLASSSSVQGPANATWTFNNLTAGDYYVALTWLDSGGNTLWASNTQLIVMNGGLEIANLRFSQQNGPSGPLSFGPLDGAQWQIMHFFNVANPTTLTVKLTNSNVDGLIIADGVLISRIGGGIPTGNSESGEGASFTRDVDTGDDTAAGSSGTQLRSDPSQAADQALLNTAYWDELDDVAVLLTDESSESSDLAVDLAAGQVDAAEPIEDDLIELLV